MAVFVSAALGVLGTALIVSSVALAVIWLRRVAFVKAAIKRTLGLDVELASLSCQLHRNPLRLDAEAENVKLFAPPEVSKDHVVVELPVLKVSIVKVASEEVAKLRHKWSVRTVFQDMQVNYVYMSLQETNLDRVVKQIAKEKEEDVKKAPAKAKKLKEPEKPKEPEEPELMAVTKLSLLGNSKIHLRAGKVALMPPITVYPMDVDPAVLQTPIGFFVWINLLVLRTLHNGGHDLALMVAKAAFSAGLYTGDKSLYAVKGMVMGGRTVLDFTFGEVTKAASGTLGAGKVVIDSTWKGASDVSKAIWTGAGAAGTATADFGGHLFTDVVTGASSTGQFFVDGAAYVGHGTVGVVQGTGKAVAGGAAYVGKGTVDVVSGTGEAVSQGVSIAGKGAADVFTGMGKGAVGAFDGMGKALFSGGGKNSASSPVNVGASEAAAPVVPTAPSAEVASAAAEQHPFEHPPPSEQDSPSQPAESSPSHLEVIEPVEDTSDASKKGNSAGKGFVAGVGSMGKMVTGAGESVGKGVVGGANQLGKGVKDGANNFGRAMGDAGSAVTNVFGFGSQKKKKAAGDVSTE